MPCCSYLIALVVGELDRREVGKRCAVYAEPGMVAAAEYEFGNTEKMLEIAESICGKFVWGRYDVLLLPPSFPCLVTLSLCTNILALCDVLFCNYRLYRWRNGEC